MCSNLSAAFLKLPPYAIGYMGDNVFQVIMTTYLRQQFHIIVPLVGGHFGGKGAKVDKY